MSIDLDSFISENSGDRARSYLFEWFQPPFPDFGKMKYYVKASSFPESSAEELSTYWQGQQYKAAGARRFGDWTVTIQSDTEGFIRSLCEEWMLEINFIAPYSNGYGEAKPFYSSGYFRPQVFVLNDNNGNPSLAVYLNNSWPKNIGAINLDYESNGIAEFDITFAYDYHVIAPTLGALPSIPGL